MESTTEFKQYEEKWFLQAWFISILFLFWKLVIPPIVGIVLIVLQYFARKKYNQNLSKVHTEMLTKQNELINQTNELVKYKEKYEKFGFNRYEDVTQAVQIKHLEINELQAEKQKIEHSINNYNLKLEELKTLFLTKNNEIEKKEKQLQSSINKLSRSKELYKSIEYCIENFFNYEPTNAQIKLKQSEIDTVEQLSPNILLKLHSMDVKELNKAFNENDKNITRVLDAYSSRYTTKANQAIYKLMVIALRAELQNLLYSLKYEKLDKCIDDVKVITDKYLKIASEGNQSIAGTLSKFIGEIEYLFINAAKIEYNYYVKKEQARQEQIALREQMRQEAAERKELEKERKRIENEETKFNQEITKLSEQLSYANDNEIEQLKARILELQTQLSEVIIKKDEIVSLENGKAGTVYIISNLGSFGEDIFKVGMTRRLDPQERVDELGSASVPFKFDVHSFIFSKDAVSLENKMHEILNQNRVNKVNSRKEFFKISLDELEKIVNKIEPTAEFNRTMVAEEFRNSQDIDVVPFKRITNTYSPVKKEISSMNENNNKISTECIYTRWGKIPKTSPYKVDLTRGPK